MFNLVILAGRLYAVGDWQIMANQPGTTVLRLNQTTRLWEPLPGRLQYGTAAAVIVPAL